jgi:hypothetical protein
MLDQSVIDLIVDKGAYLCHDIDDGGCWGESSEWYSVMLFGYKIQSFDTEAEAQPTLKSVKNHLKQLLQEY